MKQILPFLIIVILCSFTVPSKSFATKWAYSFVVWNGYVYVVTDEYVTEVDKEIGQVTKYSDMEQYTGNFSNSYKKGTKYYSIEGISTDESIAVQDGFGEYKKAVREKKYTFVGNVENLSADSLKGEKANFSTINASLLVLFSIFIFCFLYVIKKKRS